MPVYEYNCPGCGVFETIQKMTDPILRRCPKCGRSVTKLMSASSFQFKGSGWYVTDYARKGNGSSRKESSEGKEPAEKGKTSSETASGASKAGEKAA